MKKIPVLLTILSLICSVCTFSASALGIKNESTEINDDWAVYASGDVNGANGVDICDMVQLSLYLKGDGVKIIKTAADTDKNNKIEEADLNSLRTMLLAK